MQILQVLCLRVLVHPNKSYCWCYDSWSWVLMFQLDSQGTAIYLLIFCLFFPYSPLLTYAVSWWKWEQGRQNQLNRACVGSQRLRWQHWACSGLHWLPLFTLWGLLIVRAGVSLTHLMTKLSALLAITQLASNSSIKGYWDLRFGMLLGNLFTWGAQSVGILKHL